MRDAIELVMALPLLFGRKGLMQNLIGLLFVALFLLPARDAALAGQSNPPTPPINAPNGIAGTDANNQVTAQSVTPPGATNPITLGQIAAGNAFVIPRSNIGAWKPYAGTLTADDAAGDTYGGRTSYLYAEMEDQPLAVEPIFGNASPSNSYTITNYSFSGSSQLSLAGNSAASGTVAYDGSGNVVSTWSIGSFGNAGADSDPVSMYPASNALPPNCSPIGTSVAIGIGGGQTLTFASLPPNISVGSPVVLANSTGPYWPLLQQNGQTTVSAFSTSAPYTVTLSLITNSSYPIPAGTQFCFLPTGETVPVTNAPVIAKYSFGDWTYVKTFPRIDTRMQVGWSVNYNGAQVGTVQSISPTSITMPSGSTAAIPTGSAVEFCTTLTTTAETDVASTLSFPSVALLAPGMILTVNGSPPGATSVSVNGGVDFTQENLTVTSVNSGANTITINPPLGLASWSSGATYPSGTTIGFHLPITTAAPVSSGANTVQIVANGGVIVGQQITSAYIPTGTTITAISTTGGVSTLTLSAPFVTIPGGLPAGSPMSVAVTLTTNAAASAGVRLAFASVPNIKAGMYANGANIPTDDLVAYHSGVAAVLTRSPTANILTGSVVNFCSKLTTTGPVSIGQTTVPVPAAYTKYLLLMRINIAGGYADGYSYGPAYGRNEYQFALPGASRFEMGQCPAGSDGVLNPTSITPSTGCVNSGLFPIVALKILTKNRGIVIADGPGDSQIQGFTTSSQMMNYAMRWAAATSTPKLPVWNINLGIAGTTSDTFDPTAFPLIQSIKPGAITYEGWSINEPPTNEGFAQTQARQYGIARYVQAYGGVPILVTQAPHQCLGAVIAASPLVTQFELSVVADAAAANYPAFDSFTPLTDPNNPGFYNTAYTWDCGHGNDAGQALLANLFGQLMAKYARN